MNLRQNTVRLLTAALPLTPLRKLYAFYAECNSWWKYGDATFPRIISIEINSHCNRMCSYCPNSVAPQKARLMDEETLDTIIRRLSEIKWAGVVDFIFFSEPLLHPRLPAIIERVKLACPKCIPRICTNGDLLDEDIIIKLMNAGLTRIYCMRHNPAPPLWKENIEQLDSRFPGMFVLMDIDEVTQESGLCDFAGLVTVPKSRPLQSFCDIQGHCAQIDIDGNWIICCIDYAKTYYHGSLKRDGFLKIWREPAFVKLRAELNRGIARLPVCKKCTVISHS
jgi:hypothetical protein